MAARWVSMGFLVILSITLSNANRPLPAGSTTGPYDSWVVKPDCFGGGRGGGGGYGTTIPPWYHVPGYSNRHGHGGGFGGHGGGGGGFGGGGGHGGGGFGSGGGHGGGGFGSGGGHGGGGGNGGGGGYGGGGGNGGGGNGWGCNCPPPGFGSPGDPSNPVSVDRLPHG